VAGSVSRGPATEPVTSCTSSARGAGGPWRGES
jgi:hypothetical protein